jgi:hypothetical protein
LTTEEVAQLAVADSTSSLDAEHPANVNLRNRGVGLGLISSAARRVNAELDEIRGGRAVEKPVEQLERDPESGAYRPRKS